MHLHPSKVDKLPNHNNFLITKKRNKIIESQSTKCMANFGQGRDRDKRAFDVDMTM